MNKRQPFHFPLLFLLATTALHADNDSSAKVTSHTYFSVRTPFQFGSPEQLTFTRNIMLKRKEMEFTNQYAHQSDQRESYNIGLRATLFGGQSTNRDDVGRYFMPFGQPCVSVNGAITYNGIDLLPENFNIFSVKYSDPVALNLPAGVNNIENAFQSVISIKPRQSVIGLGLSFQYEFNIKDYELWFLASAPILHVRNDMGLCEIITVTGDFYNVQPITGECTNLNKNITNMAQAFNQDCWCFGKIDCDTRTTTRLAFLELILGIEWLKHEQCSINSYVGVTLPTGNKPKAEYVFEPIAGNGGHFGLIWGSALSIDVCHHEERDFDVALNANLTSQYLFKRKQTRSMDLKHKPWSRYLELYKDKAQATQAHTLRTTNIQSFFLATPGINILTSKVDVTPGFNFALNMALTLMQHQYERGFDGELGYNFYAKEAEKVCLDCSNLGTAAIKDHAGRGVTNQARNITNDLLTNEASVANIALHGKNIDNILDEYDDNVLNNCDLDLRSAAHPCVLSHTLYGAVGYHCNDMDYPVNGGLGVSYEFDHHMNTALNRWLLWGTIQVGF